MTEDMLLRELQRIEERLSERVACVEKKLDRVRAEDLPAIRTDLATLKVKAGLWGLVAGAIPAVVTLIVLVLRRHL